MKNIAKLSNEEREELFQATAIKMGIRPEVIEKDFWVCYMLNHLFHECEFKDAFVFKRKELLEKDVAFKQKFYYAKNAHYDTATLKTVSLIPAREIMQPLKDGYTAMANMFYGEAPEFEAIISFLSELEIEIHNL